MVENILWNGFSLEWNGEEMRKVKSDDCEDCELTCLQNGES